MAAIPGRAVTAATSCGPGSARVGNGEEQGWLHACGRVVQQKPMICSGGPFTAAVLHLAEIVFGVFFGRAEAATNTAARRRIQTDFDNSQVSICSEMSWDGAPYAPSGTAAAEVEFGGFNSSPREA